MLIIFILMYHVLLTSLSEQTTVFLDMHLFWSVKSSVPRYILFEKNKEIILTRDLFFLWSFFLALLDSRALQTHVLYSNDKLPAYKIFHFSISTAVDRGVCLLQHTYLNFLRFSFKFVRKKVFSAHFIEV